MSRSTTLSLNRPVRSVLRFRRWSRKGYAAFISRKHTVTIGCLAAAVADRFQQKQLSLHTGLNRLGEAVRREAHEIAASEELWEDETKHPLWANGLLCAALQSNEVAHPATDAPYYLYRYRKAREIPHGSFPPFFWAKRYRKIKS